MLTVAETAELTTLTHLGGTALVGMETFGVVEPLTDQVIETPLTGQALVEQVTPLTSQILLATVLSMCDNFNSSLKREW
jgi:hypothetical protein